MSAHTAAASVPVAPGLGLQLRPMQVGDLDAVLQIEVEAHVAPWSRGNFVDSMAAGYRLQWLAEHPAGAERARRAEREAPRCLGYYVAMAGFEEMHLLNVTVEPSRQGEGLASVLMQDLFDASRAAGAQQLWLEVRESNARARRLYDRLGFETVSRRKGYYPAPAGREDAIVMRLILSEGGAHGLD